MKKTILLALAFVAGILTMAARRGNGKRGGFNILPALSVMLLFSVLAACGGGGNIGNASSIGVSNVKKWRKHNESAADLNAVQSVCNHEAKQYADEVAPIYDALDLGEYLYWKGKYDSAYSSCMAKLGWVKR